MKELKAIKAENIAKWLGLAWNPMKELKVRSSRARKSPRPQQNVESGEGIESRSRFPTCNRPARYVESGEGIERLKRLLLTIDLKPVLDWLPSGIR